MSQMLRITCTQNGHSWPNNLKLFIIILFHVFDHVIEEGGVFDGVGDTKEISEDGVVVGGEGDGRDDVGTP